MQVFLGIFEGLIQSFVITMLTVTYLAIGTQHEESVDTHDKNSENHGDEHGNVVPVSEVGLHEHAERTIV